jgi:glycosyltransferase involved in cell wall biosynthesis
MYEKLVAPATENEITKHWKYDDKVYISIICTTYNQETYIGDAIESFLAQETAYRFEIIIHDDASTDGTRKILQEYKKRYPSIIKLILQNKNQFSININIPFKNSLLTAEGEYVAICEGDDFWIEKKKLNKQLTALQNNRELNVCFTSAFAVQNDVYVSTTCNYGSNTIIFSCNDVFEGGGGFMPTATLLIKMEVLKKLPAWFSKAPVGDYFIQTLASYSKGALYLPDTSTVYRLTAKGSYTMNNHNLNQSEAFKRHHNYKKFIKLLSKEIKSSKYQLNKVISKNNLTKIKYALYCKQFKLAFLTAFIWFEF